MAQAHEKGFLAEKQKQSFFSREKDENRSGGGSPNDKKTMLHTGRSRFQTAPYSVYVDEVKNPLFAGGHKRNGRTDRQSALDNEKKLPYI